MQRNMESEIFDTNNDVKCCCATTTGLASGYNISNTKNANWPNLVAYKVMSQTRKHMQPKNRCKPDIACAAHRSTVQTIDWRQRAGHVSDNGSLLLAPCLAKSQHITECGARRQYKWRPMLGYVPGSSHRAIVRTFLAPSSLRYRARLDSISVPISPGNTARKTMGSEPENRPNTRPRTSRTGNHHMSTSNPDESTKS